MAFITDPETIKLWINQHAININGTYEIDEITGMLNVNGHVEIRNLNVDTLPVKFGVVKGRFGITGLPITTLDGCPDRADTVQINDCDMLENISALPPTLGNTLLLSNCKKITTLCSMPKYESLRGLFITGMPKLKSLEGIPTKIGVLCISNNKALKNLDYISTNVDMLRISDNIKITSLHGISNKISELKSITVHDSALIRTSALELLLIKDMSQITCRELGAGPPQWLTIIRKYIGRPGELFECQMELIDAGFIECAQI